MTDSAADTLSRDMAGEATRQRARGGEDGTGPIVKRGRGRPPLDPAVRRKRILDAAAELFLARGYVRTNIVDVCKLAGVTKRTLYDIVGEKEALFREVCKERCAKGGEFALEMPFHDMAIRDILRTMADNVLIYALDPQTIAFNRVVAMASLRFPDLVIETISESRVVLNGAIASVFAGLMETGRIARYDPSEVADIFYDTIVGNRPLRLVMNYPEAPMTEAQLEKRIDTLIGGMFGTPASG